MVLSLIASILTAPLDLIYWIKWTLAYIGIRIYNACHSRRFDIYDVTATGDPVKLGFIAPRIEKELESPFPESHLQESSDEVLIYGVNSKSECLLVRIARGCNQVSDAWIYLKLANGKTYHLSETTGYQQEFEGKCLNFSCGKLQMHYLAPMRRWRIFYCGMLNEMSPDRNDSEKQVFVKIVFQWTASSDVYDLTSDTNPKGFASAIARSEWKTPFLPPINKFTDALNFYSQAGVVKGTVSVDDGSDYDMYLFGEKMRSLGKSENIAGCRFRNILGNTPVNGFIFHLVTATVPKIFDNLQFGFAVQSDGSLEVITDLDISVDSIGREESQKNVNASFNAGGQFELSGRTFGDPIVLHSGHGWDGFLELHFIEFEVGGNKGSGLYLCGEVYKESRKQVRQFSTASCPKRISDVPLTVQFGDEVSHFGDISGGKGSSLGKLTKLSREEKTFSVPQGIVVTTAAYKEFLTPLIIKAIKQLEDVAYGNIEGDLKEACKMVSKVIMRTPLPNKICHNIIENLKLVFGDEIILHKFAVRSSATGEDTAAMSAAGQMDTFLGVQGLKEIFNAVKNCWASQFGHIAVEYKRRYGQILNSPMAVVVQEMVGSEVSGVLFTCDPVTNNPSIITITANYGLGETVVSGSVEPDTVTLRRTKDENLKIESINVGTKHQRIVMKESGGTVTEDIPEKSRKGSCLSKELTERLAKIAIKIENYYKSSRDIEWGIVRGNIYILQSRPVTNAAAETDTEIKHEFDAPLRCEDEHFTVANVGEVMPGATSPLGIELILKYFSNVIQKEMLRKDYGAPMLSSKYYPSGILPFYNHTMLTTAEMIIQYGFDTALSRGMQISIFGRVLDDPDLLKFAKAKLRPPQIPSLKQRIRHKFNYYWDLYLHDLRINAVKKELDNYPLNFLKKKTAKETFLAILNSCSDFDEAFVRHMNSTESSSHWNLKIFTLLCEAKGNADNDVYGDFARLLSTSSNVESANVPQAMQEVATEIEKEFGNKEFKAMSAEEAVKWLQTTKLSPGLKFREFIKRHGHRCLKEFDIHSLTWEMNPESIAKLLQNLVGNGKSGKEKEEVDYTKLFAELNVPLGFWHRTMLKYILPNCRRAIRGREAGKSLTIKSMDHWRKGFWHLGKQMVSEGRIPQVDLIFFITMDEINDLLQTRSPAIISRANYRKRMFPTLDKYMFPEMMKGVPKPINDEDESAEKYEFVADLTMKGIPVSQGVTKGYARVAMSLEEASHLKPGEILITYSTDIGWSPYFPIISGVVTELGGLISHGAVVSREYGLPCVVGLQGATKKFQTGDYVLLDGKKGILQRLPKPEE